MAEPIRAVVFVGPSLPSSRPEVPGLEYRAPAASGDLRRAADAGARIIGLIDGVFFQNLAVTPRQVRQLGAAGVLLLGAASLGALRACECPTAMRGIGVIHDAFVRGELTDDDEVALTFDPLEHTLISYPLVQIRKAAELVSIAHPAATNEISTLIDRVRSLPFDSRTAAMIGAIVAREISSEQVRRRFLEALDSREADLKRQDALELIDEVRLLLDAISSDR